MATIANTHIEAVINYSLSLCLKLWELHTLLSFLLQIKKLRHKGILLNIRDNKWERLDLDQSNRAPGFTHVSIVVCTTSQNAGRRKQSAAFLSSCLVTE
jgi:hypothetical protein